jgi:RND family efflux transporter MFP subunit
MTQAGFYTRNKRWLLPLGILLLTLVVIVVMLSMRQPPAHQAPPNNIKLVDVAPVQLAPLQLQVASRGLVQPKYTTELVAQVSGEVVSVAEAFARGGFVKQGEVLASIDPINYEVRLQEARAGLASATAALELEQAQGEVARVEWQDVNERPAPALGLRKPQLKQAQAQVTAAEAALKQAQKDLQRTRIVAPYDALVAARSVSVGSYVNTGAMIGKVLDTSRAEVRLPVASSELQYLAGNGVGSAVTLKSQVAGVAASWQARIVRREGVIDDDTRMSYLVAQLEDPYHLSQAQSAAQPPLKFGSFVTAEIAGRTLEAVVRIPRNLIKEGKAPVLQAGKLALKPVAVLRHSGGKSLVTDGLNNGDLLVTTALEYPVAGMALQRFAAADAPAAADSAAEAH